MRVEILFLRWLAFFILLALVIGGARAALHRRVKKADVSLVEKAR